MKSILPLLIIMVFALFAGPSNANSNGCPPSPSGATEAWIKAFEWADHILDNRQQYFDYTHYNLHKVVRLAENVKRTGNKWFRLKDFC